MYTCGTETAVLLSFSCKNFKSFKDGFTFSMRPVPHLTGLDYSILSQEAGGKCEKALCSSVIYGPNAAGKTSVVNAASCFKQIVSRGSVLDSSDDVGDGVSDAMSLIPFRFADEAAPTQFEVEFVAKGTKFRYLLSAALGRFLQDGDSRAIVSEELAVNDQLVFARAADEVTALDVGPIGDRCNVGYHPSDDERTRKMMSDNLSPQSLLLTTDFNSFCSKQVVSEIREWFAEGLIVINSANRARFAPVGLMDEGQAIVETNLNRIAEEAGLFGTQLAYYRNPETGKTELMTVLGESEGRASAISADVIESLGTLRLVSVMPAVLLALERGATIIADEMDASIHPMIMMNIVSLFHNDEVNAAGGQIIFDTHNPVFLNNRLLRRDEIKFVERDPHSKSSRLYALSDFRANGEVSVRKTTDYMKNYFINRYGAIEDVDFTDIVTDALSISARRER